MWTVIIKARSTLFKVLIGLKYGFTCFPNYTASSSGFSISPLLIQFASLFLLLFQLPYRESGFYLSFSELPWYDLRGWLDIKYQDSLICSNG